MKKVIIVIGIIFAYAIIGVLIFRDVVDTEVGFSQAIVDDAHWVIGKTLDGSYHYGEVIVTENDTEVYRYITHYQNSLYRDMIVDHNTIYLLGYQFTKDNIIQKCFITAISTEYEVLNEIEIDITGEIYPKSIQASDDFVYLVGSFSGFKLNEEVITNNGEYDILVLQLTKALEINSINTYGDELSELVSDALIRDDELIISYNYFDSLVSGNVEEYNEGKLVSFDLSTNTFNEMNTVFPETKSRIQGMFYSDNQLIYFGNVLDLETELMTPYFCVYDTAELTLMESLESDAFLADGDVLDSKFVFLLKLEHFTFSDVYGDLDRDMYVTYELGTFEVFAIDEDIYIEELSTFNQNIYVVGYEVSKYLIKADRTKYYYEQLNFDEITD